MDMTLWKEIPAYDGENVEYYESSEETDVFKIAGTTAEGFAAYRKALEDAGFALYTENTIGENLFATYTNDLYTVHTYFIASTGVTRVIREPKGDLPVLPKDNVYEVKNDTVLTTIALETCVFWEGMSYIILLADGTFMIFDGGVSDPDGVECKKHMDLLKKYTPEGEKPVISAWFFSHCHGDHIGLVSDFMTRYHDDVIIESFIYNFPKDEEIAASDSPYMLDDSNIRWNAFRRTRVEYFPEAKVIKPHTGYKYCVKNATFEIYSTLEDLYPDSIMNSSMNSSSVLYKMEVGGQTIMWLGDAAVRTGDVAIEQFGDNLKCDLVQIAHHGFWGGTERLYRRIDPTYVLFPVCKQCYQTEQNGVDWLLKGSENVKQAIVAGFGTAELKLPYAPTKEYIKYPPTKDCDWVNPAVFD